MKLFKKQSGLTIVEAVIALAIFSMAAIVIVSLFIQHTKLFSIEEKLGSLKINKSSFARTFSDLGNAASTVVASQNIGGTLYTSSASTVIFRVPAVDNSGNLLANNFDYAVFYREGDDVCVRIEAASGSREKTGQKILAPNATNLSFVYNTAVPADALMVEAFLRPQSGTVEDPVSVSVFLRNK